MSALKRIFRTNPNQTEIYYNVIQLKKDDHQHIIGRDQDASFRINSIEISRKHALLERCVGPKNQWKISDLNSTNGLYINGTQLVPTVPRVLRDGDKVAFGPPDRTEFVYIFIQNYQSNQMFVEQQRAQSPKISSEKCERTERRNVFTELVPTKQCPLIKKRSNDGQNDGYQNTKSSSSTGQSDSAKKKQKVHQTDDKSADELNQQIKNMFDSELTCTICHELFIQAINLNCSHTFCFTCIEQWKQAQFRNQCPICRERITNETKNLIVDNLIDKMVENMKKEEKSNRNKIVEERKKIADQLKKKKCPSGTRSASASATASSSSNVRNRVEYSISNRGPHIVYQAYGLDVEMNIYRDHLRSMRDIISDQMNALQQEIDEDSSDSSDSSSDSESLISEINSILHDTTSISSQSSSSSSDDEDYEVDQEEEEQDEDDDIDGDNVVDDHDDNIEVYSDDSSNDFEYYIRNTSNHRENASSNRMRNEIIIELGTTDDDDDEVDEDENDFDYVNSD